MKDFVTYVQTTCASCLRNWPKFPPTSMTRKEVLQWWLGWSTSRKKRLYRLFLQLKRDGVVEHDYQVDYVLYKSRPREKKRTYNRYLARKMLQEMGVIEKYDGNHIHHIDGNAMNNHLSNLAVVSPCAHNHAHGKACMTTTAVSKRRK